MKTIKQEAGFSLTELMVVLALFGVVMTVVFSSIIAGQKIYNFGISTSCIHGQAQKVAEQIAKELSHSGDGGGTTISLYNDTGTAVANNTTADSIKFQKTNGVDSNCDILWSNFFQIKAVSSTTTDTALIPYKGKIILWEDIDNNDATPPPLKPNAGDRVVVLAHSYKTFYFKRIADSGNNNLLEIMVEMEGKPISGTSPQIKIVTRIAIPKYS